MPTAFSNIVANTGSSSPGELEITCSTWDVAVCCSSDCLSSLSNRAFSMAMTAWAAKFLTSSTCLSVNGREVRNVQPDRFAAAEPKVTEKAKEGNVPETFRTRLRLCDGADRLVGLETRSARVAVGLRLHVLHRQCPGHEAERIGELHEAPKSGEAAIPRISDQEANRERLQGTCCTSRAADYGIRIEGSINVDMKVVKARTDTVVAVFRVSSVVVVVAELADMMLGVELDTELGDQIKLRFEEVDMMLLVAHQLLEQVA
jgi:hypothetical protein